MRRLCDGYKTVRLLLQLQYAKRIVSDALDRHNGFDPSVEDDMIEADTALDFGIKKLKGRLNDKGYKFI